jgi:hypothetical protein
MSLWEPPNASITRKSRAAQVLFAFNNAPMFLQSDGSLCTVLDLRPQPFGIMGQGTSSWTGQKLCSLRR